MTGEGSPTWEEIAREYGRFLYTVAYRLTGNRDDAEDLVQEVLLRVRRGLDTYRPGSMEGWLSRIATNAFLDEVRRRKRRPVELLPDEADRVLPAEKAALPQPMGQGRCGRPGRGRGRLLLPRGPVDAPGGARPTQARPPRRRPRRHRFGGCRPGQPARARGHARLPAAVTRHCWPELS